MNLSWNYRCLSVARLLFSRFIPLNQLRSSAVDFLQSSMDFLAPGFFGIFINFRVQHRRMIF